MKPRPPARRPRSKPRTSPAPKPRPQWLWALAGLGLLLLGFACGWLLKSDGAAPEPAGLSGLVRIELEPELKMGFSADARVFPQLILAQDDGKTLLVDLQGRTVAVELLGDVPFEPILDGGRYFKVLRVIDGDTMELDLGSRTIEVRLLGIDTPEVKDPRKPVQFWGKEASAFANEELQGKMVRLDFDAENRMDVYGRLLAYVYVLEGEEEIDFCKRMIDLGFARAFERDWCRFSRLDEFIELQSSAERLRLGLWDHDAEEAWHKARADAERDLTENALFVTTSGSEVFHVRDCPRAPAEKNWLYLTDRAAAEAEGLRPHRCAEQE